MTIEKNPINRHCSVNEDEDSSSPTGPAETALARLDRLNEHVLLVEEVLEWLGSHGLDLCSRKPSGFSSWDGDTDHYVRCGMSHRELVFRALGIDPVQLDKERALFLDNLRKQSST